jgi:hypothetical protein|tara:strand:+ start:65 stop:661 length:597 start_codon:yes stop_codon:yes gene_type:complete
VESNTIEVNQDTKTISIADVGLYSIDVSDNTVAGSIDVTTETNTTNGVDIVVSNQTNTISQPTSPNVTLQIDAEPYNAVHVNVETTNEISITDNVALAVQPISPLIHGADGHYGIGLVDPAFQLQLSEDLFAPLISSSRLEINGNGTQDLFLVKLNDSSESKFVINLEGVTLLGAFSQTPSYVSGGMFYSSSGDFYLG